MGSHKKHKYYKKKSKKSKKHKKTKINLKEVHDRLKNDKKYSNLISTLSIKDKRNSNEKRSRSESSDDSKMGSSLPDGTGRRKIKYKYKKSRSSSMTSSSSSTSSIATLSSSSPSSSSSSDEKHRKTKHKKKKLKKDDKKKKIEMLNKKHEEGKKLKIDESYSGKKNNDDFNYDKKRIKKIKLSNEIASTPGPFLPEGLLQKSKTMAPMSKEEWERKQNEIRRVYDQETGRYRLIKGDGEVLEEIVSRSRHREINKQATAGDGNFFQTTLTSQLKK